MALAAGHVTERVRQALYLVILIGTLAVIIIGTVCP